MSNHHHLVLTDGREGGIADFAQWMHGQFSRAINRSIKHWEGFWDPTRSYSAQLLGIAGELDPIDYAEDVLERMVYAVTNPVKANLVKTYRDWPGICSLNWRIGETISVRRPKGFFKEDGPTPPEITFRFDKPFGYEALSNREFDELFREEVQKTERQLNRKRREAGRRVFGRAHVLKKNPLGSPKTPAPQRQIKPKVSSSCPKRRSYLLNRIGGFLAVYRECVRLLLKGASDVVFPYGTLQRRRYAGAICCGPEDRWEPTESRPPP